MSTLQVRYNDSHTQVQLLQVILVTSSESKKYPLKEKVQSRAIFKRVKVVLKFLMKAHSRAMKHDRCMGSLPPNTGKRAMP